MARRAPQEGRYREFTQCDIDVINVDQVPLHFDVELPRIIHEILTGLCLPTWSLAEGLDELAFVLDSLSDLPTGSVMADLSIARGLDYYTDTVYEGKFIDWPYYGSICSGGWYGSLAGSFIRRSLPGIGLSIGLPNLRQARCRRTLQSGPSCPSDVLVVIPDDQWRPQAVATATQLRARGFNTELYHQIDKLAKQIRYASHKGIPSCGSHRSRAASATRSKTWPPVSSARPIPRFGSDPEPASVGYWSSHGNEGSRTANGSQLRCQHD